MTGLSVSGMSQPAERSANLSAGTPTLCTRLHSVPTEPSSPLEAMIVPCGVGRRFWSVAGRTARGTRGNRLRRRVHGAHRAARSVRRCRRRQRLSVGRPAVHPEPPEHRSGVSPSQAYDLPGERRRHQCRLGARRSRASPRGPGCSSPTKKLGRFVAEAKMVFGRPKRDQAGWLRSTGPPPISTPLRNASVLLQSRFSAWLHPGSWMTASGGRAGRSRG